MKTEVRITPVVRFDENKKMSEKLTEEKEKVRECKDLRGAVAVGRRSRYS